MKTIHTYALLLLLVSGMVSCKYGKTLDQRVSLWRMDKIPYGTKYAFDNLSYIFPKAEIRAGKEFPSIYTTDSDDTTRVLLIITPQFNPTPEELRSIIRFADHGNQVFISSLSFDDTVFKMLDLRGNYNVSDDAATMSVFNSDKKSWESYTYPGYSNTDYFDSLDETHSSVLGRNNHGKPDFIRIPYAHGGALFIHLNPFTFTNFFLLHKNNRSYYDIALSNLTKEAKVVEWSDYYRYSKAQPFSSLQFIQMNRSLRWAFWITICLFLLLFVFGSKRKQRPIIEKKRVRNTSLDFVKTVGQLYFQQKGNQNLALKMVAGFLEQIRADFKLSTNILDDEFSKRLSMRTGKSETEITALMQQIHSAYLNSKMTDLELMALYHQINIFYKQQG